MPNRPKKLPPLGKSLICRLIALGYSIENIRVELKEQLECEISYHLIWRDYWRPYWMPSDKVLPCQKRHARLIHETFVVLQQEIMKEPLYHKRMRINVATKAINTAIKKKDIGPISRHLEEIRREVEGDKPLLDASQHSHFHLTVEQRKAKVDAILKRAGVTKRGVDRPGEAEARTIVAKRKSPSVGG